MSASRLFDPQCQIEHSRRRRAIVKDCGHSGYPDVGFAANQGREWIRERSVTDLNEKAPA